MQRRDFAAAAALAGLGLAVQAQPASAPVEGRQYQRLRQPQPTPADKIELIEFFWFGCPACFAFDPVLEAWTKTLPPDVAFRRVPVGFNALHKLHQRMFYALEAMGQEAAVHERVFNAIHRERADITDEAAITALMGRLGVDAARFKSTFNAFGVQSKAQQAVKLSQAYGVDSIPTLAVAGRFTTSPSSAGGGREAVAVAEHLIRLARNKG